MTTRGQLQEQLDETDAGGMLAALVGAVRQLLARRQPALDTARTYGPQPDPHGADDGLVDTGPREEQIG